MKMDASDFIYQLNQLGFARFPDILTIPLVEAIRFVNSMAKFDRFHSGKAYVSDLNGPEAEKRYLIQRLGLNKG